jgi:hypothetical protein
MNNKKLIIDRQFALRKLKAFLVATKLSLPPCGIQDARLFAQG